MNSGNTKQGHQTPLLLFSFDSFLQGGQAPNLNNSCITNRIVPDCELTVLCNVVQINNGGDREHRNLSWAVQKTGGKITRPGTSN